MAEKRSFRDDTIYANRDRICGRCQRRVERALDAWLKFDTIGTPRERAARTKFERAQKAYVGAVKMRMRRREILMRHWGLDR